MAKRNFMNSIPMLRPRRNTFDLSCDRKTDAMFGLLMPIYCADVIPSDRFEIRDELLIRFDALIAPILHNVNVYVHYFFVPNRLLWDDWEEFITGGPDGTSDKVPAGIDPGSEGAGDYFKEHGLYDYLGVQPLDVNTGVPQGADPIDLNPLRAYQKIFSDYYRDQNLTDEVELYTDVDGLLDPTDSDQKEILDNLTTLRYRAWEKDYFTSALPWTQRGAQMSIPFNLDPLPVRGATYIQPGAVETGLPAKGANTQPYGVHLSYYRSANNQYHYGSSPGFWNVKEFDGEEGVEYYGVPNNVAVGGPGGANYSYLQWLDEQQNNSVWYLSGKAGQIEENGLHAGPATTIGAPTINDLRVAMRIQEWMEINAVGGSRYIEQIYAHFGVRSSDSRLQRAEYLGGGKVPVVVSEVEQTSSTDSESPQGNLAGQALCVGKTIKFRRYFEEHGWILGIMSIMPRSSYSQGVPKMFTRRTKFDYFWPKFAHLGEQPIYNQELYLSQSADPKGVFGYTPRYAEYRFSPSTVHGSLRSSKSFWHLSRIFDSQPNLNEQFVYLNETTSEALDRIFAVTGNWPMTVEIFHRVRAKRPIPRFGTPTL